MCVLNIKITIINKTKHSIGFLICIFSTECWDSNRITRPRIATSQPDVLYIVRPWNIIDVFSADSVKRALRFVCFNVFICICMRLCVNDDGRDGRHAHERTRKARARVIK